MYEVKLSASWYHTVVHYRIGLSANEVFKALVEPNICHHGAGARVFENFIYSRCCCF